MTNDAELKSDINKNAIFTLRLVPSERVTYIYQNRHEHKVTLFMLQYPIKLAFVMLYLCDIFKISFYVVYRQSLKG